MKGLILYLARHGETLFNLEDRIGGNPGLTEEGVKQTEKVARVLKNFRIDAFYCSTLRRSIHTAQIIHEYHSGTPLIRVPELDELNQGDLDLMTYSEFEEKFPGLFEARKKDKYHFVYPNGENYATMTERVAPFLGELRTKGQIAGIVGHQGINRVILGYLLDLPKEEIPYMVIPNDVVFVIDLKDPSKVYHIKDGKRIEGYVVE